MAEKRNITVIFLIGIIIFTAIMFYSGDNRPVEVDVSKTSNNTTENLEIDDIEPMTPEEIEKYEAQAAETTFWMWEGKEAGTPSTEYITLTGEGMYILTIELSEHDPYSEHGLYEKKNSEGTKVAFSYKEKWQTAEIKGNKLMVEDKIFKQLSESHF